MARIKKEAPERSHARRKPEFSDELLDETTRIWQPLSRRTLTRADASEIMENMTGFFRTLIEWKRREVEAAKTKPSHKTGAGEGIPKYHRGGGNGVGLPLWFGCREFADGHIVNGHHTENMLNIALLLVSTLRSSSPMP